MAEFRLRTERLVLRTEIEGDQAIWRAHMNTPEVMARLGGPRTDEEVAASFAKMRAAADAGEPTFHCVERASDGALIGKCGLAVIDSGAAPARLQGQVQAGWSLRADCWGQGYAREAAEAMIDHGFAHFGLEAVYAQTSQSNVPSWRLMQKLGMERMGELDYADPDYPPEIGRAHV